MSRTPLFRFVRRSMLLAQRSLHTGEPPKEIVERFRAVQISRRRFLATTAAVGAGLAAGCRFGREEAKDGNVRPIAGKGGPAQVLIVGGGIAGLTCGYRLQQAGVPFRILEAQDRIGGRMRSLRGHFPEGHVVELGGELIDTGHAHIRAMAAELGLQLDDYEQDDPNVARDLWFFDGRRYSDAEVVEAFRPIAAKIEEAWEEIGGDWVSFAEPNNGARLDAMSIAQWLDEAGAEGWFRELLDVGYTTEFGREIAEQSAMNFLGMIDTNPDPFRIFGESDERFHVRGGNDQIPTLLAQKLGDRVETGVKLEAVSQAADGSYRCSVRRGSTSETISAERLVLAIPFTLLRDVQIDVELPEVKRLAIKDLGYGTNAKLMVGFSERVWRTEGRSNGSTLTDLPYQLTWETTRLVPGTSGVLVNFTGGERGVAIGEGTPSQQAERFAADLERVYPGIAGRRIGEARFHWPTFPWTRGSYACYLPGQYVAFGGEEGTAVGNLHFAGEHTSVDAQGYMEGGCESGDRVATEILTALNLPLPQPLLDLQPAEEEEEAAA